MVSKPGNRLIAGYPAAGRTTPATPHDGTRVIRVVEVDVEALLRPGFGLILNVAADDITVVTTATGADAFDAVRKHRPDVVLLDVRMPDVDGLTVLGELPTVPDAPVVAMLTIFDTDWQAPPALATRPRPVRLASAVGSAQPRPAERARREAYASHGAPGADAMPLGSRTAQPAL